MEYQIQANTRQCAASGRELKVGERLFSVLLEDEGKLVRRDYSCENWQGPPANTFSFWMGRVPAVDESRRPRIHDDLLIDCFQRLSGQNDPDRINFRYIVALLLMRRKRLKFEQAMLEGDKEILCLRCVRTRTQYQVINPRLTEEEMGRVQEEVLKVLGWE